MKRVVALLLIASVALFAAVAPQSDLKVNAGTPMAKRPAANLVAEPFQIEDTNVRTLNTNMSKAPALAVDTSMVTVVYLEDFENGAPGWEQYDGTFDARAVWTLDDWYGTGDSLWWCGDGDLGGYADNWLVALQTPPVVLTPGDSTLSFQLSMAVEDPGGSGDYDGWDGANLQISNDSGATWTVLPVEGVPYAVAKFWTFMFQASLSVTS